MALSSVAVSQEQRVATLHNLQAPWLKPRLQLDRQGSVDFVSIASRPSSRSCICDVDKVQCSANSSRCAQKEDWRLATHIRD